MTVKTFMSNKKIIFTFSLIYVIFLSVILTLTGCLEKETDSQEVLYFSFKEDCPQCSGFKSVKSENGALVTCSFCNGQGFVYKDPQGTYKNE